MVRENLCRSLTAIVILSFLVHVPAYAFLSTSVKIAVKAIQPLIKHKSAISSDEIEHLAKLGNKTGGTKEIRVLLGSRNLPPAALEDAYMRILIQQEKISRMEAEGMMSRLNGISGFRSTLSKIVGNSKVKTDGHLNELRIADSAAQREYKVNGIGVKFNDGRKAADTDIDVLLRKNGKAIAIEAKNYQSVTPIPMDKFRADMDSLVAYAKQNPSDRVLKVFSITNKPSDPQVWKLLNKAADRRSVQLIVGTPEQQVKLIGRLIEELR